MGWLWLVLIVAALVLLASFGRQHRQRQTFRALRGQFPKIARLRLIATCPGLDGVIQEADLRFLFDWIAIELCRRTGVQDMAGLMRWSLAQGQETTERLTAEVTREAVDRLPRPVLGAIDECRGRTVAGVILDEALTEAGHRVAPQPRPAN